MSELVWYRSLYWRIAIGFVALVAVLLTVQGLAFLWMTGRMNEIFPGRSPDEFAQAIAADLANEVKERPTSDIDAFLNTKYAGSYRAFGVAMSDGRAVTSRGATPAPPMIIRAAWGRLQGFPEGGESGRGGPGRGGYGRGGDRRGDGGPRGLGGPTGAPPPGPPGSGDRGPGGGPGAPPSRTTYKFAPVVVEATQIGMVAVPVEPPPLSVTLRQVGPPLAAMAIGLLIAGTAVAALVVFRPTHRRLRALQGAAKALGEGRSGIRASEAGGDEVSALARAFNEMATGLEARAAALTEADRTRRQLLADVSHELMTPLSAIRGYVETLEMKDLALDEPTRARYLHVVGEESERLEHIVGDLLDLARLEGGGGNWRQQSVSVAHLFERAEDRHWPTLRDKQITLETSLAPGATTVTGDSNRLEQAIQNLVANAARHTPVGGRIRLTADAIDAGVRIAVEDSGPGIPDEHVSRVFDRFYKVDMSRTNTATPSGSGLGLSIVRAIVERHGGTITAANTDGGGARFEVVLPSIA